MFSWQWLNQPRAVAMRIIQMTHNTKYVATEAMLRPRATLRCLVAPSVSPLCSDSRAYTTIYNAHVRENVSVMVHIVPERQILLLVLYTAVHTKYSRTNIWRSSLCLESGNYHPLDEQSEWWQWVLVAALPPHWWTRGGRRRGREEERERGKMKERERERERKRGG